MKYVFIITASVEGETSILSVHTSAEKARKKVEKLSAGGIGVVLEVHAQELDE